MVEILIKVFTEDKPTTPEKQIEFLSKIISNYEEYDKFIKDPKGYCSQQTPPITLDEEVVEEFVKGCVSTEGDETAETLSSSSTMALRKLANVKGETLVDVLSIILPNGVYQNLTKPRPGVFEIAKGVPEKIVKELSKEMVNAQTKNLVKAQTIKPVNIDKVYESSMFVIVDWGDGDLVVYYKLAWRIQFLREALQRSNILNQGRIVIKK